MRRALTCAAVLLLATSAPAGDEPPSLVFRGATVLDGVGGRTDGPVLLRDGKIAAVSDVGVATSGQGRTFEVKGAYLTPGLIDAASRAGYALDPSEVTREMTPFVDVADLVDPRHRTLRAAAAAGCTTVLLCPGSRNVVSGTSRVYSTLTRSGRAESVKDGHRALHVVMTSDATRGNFPPRSRATTSIYARRPTTRMGVVWILRQTFLAAKGVQSAPNDADLAPFSEVLAGKRPLRILAHRTQDMSAALRMADEVGFRPVFEGGEEAYALRKELARRKIAVVVGPYPSLRSGTGPDYTDSALSNPALLHRAGVRVALTAGSLGGARLRDQAMLAVRFGLRRKDALAAITSRAAELCGLSDRGRIEVGLVADVVLWSGHPLLPASRPLVVVVGGHVVHQDASIR